MSYLGPVPRSVDWPTLVALCAARGVPVVRVDRRGAVHVIRTPEQLARFEAAQHHPDHDPKESA